MVEGGNEQNTAEAAAFYRNLGWCRKMEGSGSFGWMTGYDSIESCDPNYAYDNKSMNSGQIFSQARSSHKSCDLCDVLTYQIRFYS